MTQELKATPRVPDGEPTGALYLRLAHLVLAGVAGAVWTMLLMILFVGAVFVEPLAAVVIAAVAPVLLLVVLAALTRWTTGRARWWWNIAVTATASVVAATVTVSHPQLPVLAAVEPNDAPLAVGVAVGVASMVVFSRTARLVGVIALVAQLVVVGTSAVQNAREAAREAVAQEEAAFQHMVATTTRPYVVPGLTVHLTNLSVDRSVVWLTDEPDAPRAEELDEVAGDVEITTRALVASEEVDHQVCGIALDPNLGGSAANSCDLRSPDTWFLTIGREPVVVRVVDDDVVQLRGASLPDLTALARRVEPMTRESFEQENRYWFERYKEV